MTGGPQWPRVFRTAVLLLSLLSAASARYRLLVLHTNDMHSRFDQVDESTGECSATDGRLCYGGFARLKTAVRRERSRTDAGPVDGALFLNAGDTFQGTPYYSFLRWRAVERMVRTLGIDVMVSARPLPHPRTRPLTTARSSATCSYHTESCARGDEVFPTFFAVDAYNSVVCKLLFF